MIHPTDEIQVFVETDESQVEIFYFILMESLFNKYVCNLFFFFLDDEEALNSIMKDLAALGRCYSQHNSHKPKIRSLLYKQVQTA